MIQHTTLPMAAFLFQGTAGSAAGVDWLSVFAQNLTNLTAQNGGVLTSFGMTELSFVALFMLISMVVKWSTATMSFSFHHEPLRAGDFVYFMLRLIFCLLLENYWASPLPGVPWGLNHFFSYTAEMISQTLDQNTLTQLQTTIKTLVDGLTAPSLTAPVELLVYVLIELILALSSAILFLINVSGFILYGVSALFGPIFIPLYMTNSLRGKFFHFVDVLLGLAMIRAVASASIFVWSGFMTTFVQQTFNGDYSIGMWLANLVPVIALFIAFDINMLFIPSLTQSIFGGNAGMAGRLEQAATKVAAALL